MKMTNRNFLYPVLFIGTDDYVDSSFELLSIDYENLISKYKFIVKLELKNDGLWDLINKNQAEFVVHLECSKTFYREIYVGNSEEITFFVDAEDIDGKLEILTFVIAKEDIKNYHNELFHRDYHEVEFDINKGQFLAIGGSSDIFITKNTKNLGKLSSIIRISSVGDLDGEVRYDLMGDRIYIRVSDEQYSLYNYAKNSPHRVEILHGLLIYPALIYIFEELRRDSHNDFETYSEMRWFRSIDMQLKANKITLDKELFESNDNQPYQLAQRLLNNPIDRALITMRDIDDMEWEES